MTHSHHQSPPAPDLDVQAVRYVTGEMNGAEVEAFEARLGTDQAARESVARAVEIGMAVRQVVPVPQPAPLEFAAPARAGKVWLAAAVLLFGLGLVWLLRSDDPTDVAPTAPAVAVDQDLMEGWTDFSDDFGDLDGDLDGELLADSEIEPVVDPIEATFPESAEWIVEVLNR